MKRIDQQKQTLPNTQHHTGYMGQRAIPFATQQVQVPDLQHQMHPTVMARTPSSM